MGSLQKRTKVLEDAEDRISKLSDSILCHILSFLPTKDAGRTSILSTRWKYLFFSSPTLDFDDSLRLYLGKCNLNSRRNFVNFVYRVLLLRSSLHLNRFRLKCRVKHNDPHVKTWISAAVCRNVQELELKLDISHDLTEDGNSGLLPNDLLNCRALVVLKLDVNGDLNVPSDVSFPSLKILHLQSLFIDYDSYKRILSGCPVLEDLLTYDCMFVQKVQAFDISIPTLKRLTLGLQYLSTRGNFYESEVVIDAPCLQYFRYSGNAAKNYTLKGLTSLAEAHICIVLSACQDRLSYGSPLSDLFKAISMVESLHLSGCSVRVVKDTQCWLPTFPNLTRLELDSDHDTGLVLLPQLLYSSPKLEALVIGEGFVDVKESLINFPDSSSGCLSHLKEVELKEFNGKEDELQLVEYLLESAEVLEKMTISYFGLEQFEMDLHIGKKLLTFPRHSKACRIFLNVDLKDETNFLNHFWYMPEPV
ncbi:F-box protein At4g22280-like isoform X2 [Malania oleifera]|uniref:F-box protein At4g22280-like isoform X2 n=1 Tax=Malania oleifera TaxID=397392 RepID=UPI0025ADB1D0|nr:F-box protein At4g22280-like isoform X2 [Malania oleifera]